MIDVEMEVGKKKERENSGKKKKNGKQSILLLDFRFLVSPNAGHNSGLPLPPPRALGVEERERESSKYFRTGFALHARPAHLLHAHACQFAIPGVGISDT